MDANHFDALTRLLPGGSRRRVVFAALGGVLGLPLLGGLEASAKDPLAKCKKKKGKAKKKCIEKAQGNNGKPKCKADKDCADQIESCQSGKCQPVCPQGACRGCDVCLVHLETSGNRSRLCSDSPEIPAQLTTCATDADCPLAAPLCVSFAEISCTAGPCGTCVAPGPPCGGCRNDADCSNQTESCQGGLCKPVCSSNACPAACDLCAVQFSSGGGRTPLCGDGFTFADSQTCTTNADCDPGDLCIRFPTTSCTQPPCGECALSVEICA
jgi:hypothetical protein